MKYYEILLREYCRDKRLTDEDIVELLDCEGIAINKENVKEVRKKYMETNYWVWIVICCGITALLLGVMR